MRVSMGPSMWLRKSDSDTSPTATPCASTTTRWRRPKLHMRSHTPVKVSLVWAVATGPLITSATGVAVLVQADSRRSMSCSVRMPTGLPASITTTHEMPACAMHCAACASGAVLPRWAMARVMMSASSTGAADRDSGGVGVGWVTVVWMGWVRWMGRAAGSGGQILRQAPGG